MVQELVSVCNRVRAVLSSEVLPSMRATHHEGGMLSALGGLSAYPGAMHERRERREVC